MNAAQMLHIKISKRYPIMSITAMVQAARDGKVVDFEAAFNQAMSGKILDAIDSVKADIGASVAIDGEEVSDGSTDGK